MGLSFRVNVKFAFYVSISVISIYLRLDSFQKKITFKMCENCNDFQLLLYRVERDHEAAIAGKLLLFKNFFQLFLIFFLS